MKSILKNIIGVVIIGLMIIYPNLALAETETELKNQKSENNEKIEEAQNKKEEVTAQKNQTIDEVNKLTDEITNYQSQINDLDSQIDEANQKIEEQTQKLQEAEEKYNEQQDTLNTRIVALYEAGETSYLDVLLSSDSVTDFISNYYLISEIAECDLDLLEQIDNQKQEITKAKEELENSKNQLATAKADKERVSQELQAKKDEKNTYVEQLSQEEQNIEAQIEELRQANVQIDKDIETAREAARKKLEEEQRKKNQNNNSSNSSSGSNGNSGSNGSSSSGGSTSNASSSGFIYPVPSGYTRITTGMYYSSGSYHGAVDFGTGGISGQPVYAVADGVVITAKALTTSYGNYIIIMHRDGLYTLYAHGQAGSIAVSQGQYVKQGQQIMRVGNTGNSFGAHLHFEVRTGNGLYSDRVDPRPYLP